jgi:hypothetical protein
MADHIPIIVASASLGVSAFTMWFTLLRKGNVRMTQPTIVFFGPDGGSGEPKVFLRTLLYSTGKRGRIVESMFVKLRRSESVQTFNIWIYGEKQQLVRGSGIHVGFEGITCNHHFLLPKDGTGYEFLPGDYVLEVYVSPLHAVGPVLLSKLNLVLTKEQADALKTKKAGVYFDWGPDSAKYHAHIDEQPKPTYSGTLI